MCLIGVDTHLAWCGRCDSLEQNYRSLHMKFDEDFNRMQFFSASEEFVPQDVMAGLSNGPLTCKPRILLFYEGEKKDEIDGADYTELETKIARHIPQFDD